MLSVYIQMTYITVGLKLNTLYIKLRIGFINMVFAKGSVSFTVGQTQVFEVFYGDML